MITLFVLKLCAGITLMWWLMPREEVTDGFFRIQTRVVLGLAVLATLMLYGSTTFPASIDEKVSVQAATRIRMVTIAISIIAYAATVFWALGRRTPGNICIHLLFLLSAGALAVHSWHIPNNASLAQQLVSDYSTAAVAGGVLTGMLLGHWYLTTPTMSIRPLWWFNKAILISAIIRLGTSAWVFWEYPLQTTDTTQQIWLGLRWLAGIVGPLVTTLLVWRILKHRNTQSATGVLFAGLILVFMGEMTAALLERETLIPY